MEVAQTQAVSAILAAFCARLRLLLASPCGAGAGAGAAAGPGDEAGGGTIEGGGGEEEDGSGSSAGEAADAEVDKAERLLAALFGVGLLVHWESLLSVQGHERGMLQVLARTALGAFSTRLSIPAFFCVLLLLLSCF
jgi:hypothetical protein